MDHPQMTTTAYVLAIVAVLALAAWIIAELQLAAARAETDEARADVAELQQDHEDRLRAEFNMTQELEAAQRQRVHLVRSRDDALRDLHVQRALTRTLAGELDKRTQPHGWSMRAHDMHQQPGEPAKCIDCGAESPAGGPLPELPCPGPDLTHAGFDGREPLEPARYPHPVTVSRESVTRGVQR